MVTSALYMDIVFYSLWLWTIIYCHNQFGISVRSDHYSILIQQQDGQVSHFISDCYWSVHSSQRCHLAFDPRGNHIVQLITISIQQVASYSYATVPSYILHITLYNEYSYS